MKKMLSIFATLGLVSTSSLQMVSCDDAKKSKDMLENKENEQKDEDNNNGNNGNITDETKRLTTEQTADKIVQEFKSKKASFINKMTTTKPNTVAEFYEAVENEFKADSKDHTVEIKHTIKNGKDELNKETESAKKIYVGTYSISIDIKVDTISKSINSFEYVISAPIVELTPNIKWKREVEDLKLLSTTDGTYQFNEEFVLVANWADLKVDEKKWINLYDSVEIDYVFTFEGYISEVVKSEDLKKEAKLGEYEETRFSKWYNVKDGYPEFKMRIEASIGIAQNVLNKNTIQLNANIFGVNKPKRDTIQSVTIEISKIKLIPKK